MKSITENTEQKTEVRTMPGRNGGTLQVGNPGNKGGGRHKEYMEERAALLAADPMVWNVQLARARAGDIRVLEFAADRAFGKAKDTTEHTGQITIEHIYEHRE